MYLIVEFQSNEIALVPKEWMVASGREVRYPPYKTDLRIRKAARSREPPSENWTYEQVKKILYQDGKRFAFVYLVGFYVLLLTAM